MIPLWLRPWPQVREIFRKAEAIKDRIRAEALAAGIECRLKDAQQLPAQPGGRVRT